MMIMMMIMMVYYKILIDVPLQFPTKSQEKTHSINYLFLEAVPQKSQLKSKLY